MLNNLGELLKSFWTGLGNIRNRISKFNVQEVDWQTRPVDSIEMQGHIHGEIDAAAAEGEADLLSLQRQLDPATAGRHGLIFHRTYDPNRDITMLINAFHFFIGDIEKEKIQKLFADKWPKNAITSEDRERKLKEIRSGRATAEREEESAIMELEMRKISVDRRPDETPDVFLEWDGKSFNQSKLSQFHRESMARQAAINNLNQEIGGFSAQIRELDTLFQRAELTADRGRLEKQLQSLRIERDKLTAKRDELEQGYEPRLKLYNRATDFLRGHGIRV